MLIECPECHNQISSDATSCPHCGKPMKEVQSSSQEFFDTWKNQPEVKKIRGCQKASLIFCLICAAIIFVYIIFMATCYN